VTRKGGVPPEEYRFRKGETGNPKGRPLSSTQTRKSAFDVITEPELTIRTGETTTTLSAEEALHLKTYQQAINGDKKAWAEVLDMIIAREKALDALAPPTPGPELLIEKGDPDNAHEAMVLLGIASYDTERSGFSTDPERGVRYLLLEAWAVQMALQHRSLTHLDDSRKLLVRAWTRDRDRLKWPPRFGHVRE
jgi:hypothetical protein